MGCEGVFNYTKFTRMEGLKSKFCIDEDNDYELNGNFETQGTSKVVLVNIDRCKTAPGQVCK